ncbi:Alpha/Beta hydrolase protein [Lipomyces starkeyi]
MDNPSRLSLRLTAFIYRSLSVIFTALDLYVSLPLPRRASFQKWIPSTVSKTRGSIRLLFYTPESFVRARSASSDSVQRKRYPVLVNFHGGGFCIGNPHDDARWATAVVEAQDAVVVSVGYRLAPEYPHPVAVDDGVDAILWIWEHAHELNLDRTRIALSGFSAGGNLSFAVALKLNEIVQKRMARVEIQLVGIVAFYPSVDWTQTRADRTASNIISREKSLIPERMFKFFDASYLYPQPIDMGSPYLSPGLASEQLLVAGLPERLMVYSCEWDQLLVETEKFRQQLQGLGKKVGGRMVEGEAHAWDKRPSFMKGDEKRDRVYAESTAALGKMWQTLYAWPCLIIVNFHILSIGLTFPAVLDLTSGFFEREGAPKCGERENPAEYILNCIGAGATAAADRDWSDVCTNSPNFRKVTTDIEQLNTELSALPPQQIRKEFTEKFAVGWPTQAKAVLFRTYRQYWRSPTYIIAKFVLYISAGLFTGFSFWK